MSIRFLPLIVAIIVIIFTALVSIPGSPFLIGGHTQKEISDMFRSAINPAGYVFSIWSVIYASWLYLGYKIAKKDIRLEDSHICMLSSAYLLTAIWLIPWGLMKTGIALIVITALLFLLWYLFAQTKHIGGVYRSIIELFMGWIHIATFASIGVYLNSINIAPAMSENYLFVGYALLVIACIATVLFVWKFRAYVVGLVYIWASIGIIVDHSEWYIRPIATVFLIAVIIVMIRSYTHKLPLWTKKLEKMY